MPKDIDYGAIARQHGGVTLEENYDRPPDLLTGFGKNLLGSAGQFVSDLAAGVGQAVAHPQITGQGVLNLGAGVIEKMAPLPQPGPHEPYAEAAGEAIRKHVVDRYGSPDKFAETFYQDPVGTMADVSMVIGGGEAALKGAALIPKAAGMARTASALERGGEILGTAANVTDPMRVGFQAATLPMRPFGVAQKIYQSAIKPPPGSYSLPETRAMMRTGLEARIPMSEGGLTKLWGLIDDLNTKVTDATESAGKRGVTVDPKDVARRVDEITPTFSEQVNPEKNLRQLAESKQEFLRQHQTQVPFTKVLPSLDEGGGYFPVGQGTTAVPTPIPADAAQRIKVGTYQQIKKSYGEMKNAQIESQKALARGIKEELATAIPEIGALNAKESDFLQLVPVIERAIRRESNHQIFGIGTPIFAGGVGAATGSAQAAAAAGTLRAVLDNPYVKSRLAIAIHHAQKANPGKFGPARMASATARLESYLRGLDQMQKEQDAVPATAGP